MTKRIERLMRDFSWEGVDEGKLIGIGDASKRKRQFGGEEFGEKERVSTWEMAMEAPGGKTVIMVCSH